MAVSRIVWPILLVLALAGLGTHSRAQGTGGVGIGILNPDSSALLHLESTTRGFLGPRMTTAQRNAINSSNPAIGLVVYNTDDSLYQFWNGACWLPYFLETCEDCYFNMSLSDSSGTIDRTVSDSIQFTVNITQTYGTPQSTGINVLGVLPQGLSTNVTPNPIFSTGSATITFRVTPFTPAGIYPVLIQAFCGVTQKSIVYTLEILPCYQLNILNNTTNYNVATDLYATYPGAPTASPVCVNVEVDAGVLVSSPSVGQPAFSTGALPAGSVVGIVNEGLIIGKGGDGGDYYNVINGGTPNGAGITGGDALNLTAKTSLLQANGYIFGGGGGGGSTAIGFGYPPTPVSVFGVVTIPANLVQFAIGAGGGGGAGGGLGGSPPSSGFSLGFVYYENGYDGTSGLGGTGGLGGSNNNPFTINIFNVNVFVGNVSADVVGDIFAIGGKGGEYGQPGNVGQFQLKMDLTATFDPIIGPNITGTVLSVPIDFTTFGLTLPTGGAGGYAVRRNGNLFTSFPDGLYNTSFIKGRIGN